METILIIAIGAFMATFIVFAALILFVAPLTSKETEIYDSEFLKMTCPSCDIDSSYITKTTDGYLCLYCDEEFENKVSDSVLPITTI